MTPDSQSATFAGAAADMIAQTMREVAAGQRTTPDGPGVLPAQAPQQPAQQPAQQPVQPQIQQPAQPQVQQPAQPQVQQVSTDPVGDIAGRFRTPVTPAPEQKAELPPDTPVEAPPEIEGNEKAKSAWEILRNRERESRHLAESLKSRLEETSRQAGAVAEERQQFADELKARDERIAQLEDELGKLDLSHRPEFRHQYDEPMAGVKSEFRAALDAAAEMTPETLDATAEKLLAVDDTEFNRLVAQLDAAAQGSLWDKRRRFRELDLARSHAVQEWKSTQAGLAAVDQQEQVAKRAQRMAALADGAINFTQRLMPADQRPSVLGESTYAEDVKNADGQFKSFMQVANEEEIARVAYQGFLVPVMQRQVAYLVEALETMQDAYYRLRGAGAPPALPMRSKPPAPPPPPAPANPVVDRGGSFSNTVENTMMNVLNQALVPRA